MAIIVSGHERGLLDSSLGFLGRNDRTGLDDPGSGNQLYINVANGNLVLQERDAYLPSLGDDYLLVRTYNSRGLASDAHQHDDAGWSFTTTIRLDERHDGGERYFALTYGDGSVFEYRLNATTGLYESVDGAGAYETLEDLGVSGDTEPAFIVTRADQTRLSFDKQGHLLSLTDPNGVGMTYRYESDRLVEVRDDEGHVIEYRYRHGHLYRIIDESEGVLAEYHYSHGRLDEVIDRFGHSTRYEYDHQGNLEKLSLPYRQRVDGEREHYEQRELRFEYEQIQGLGAERFLSRIIDAEGGVTQFDYSFDPITGQGQASGTTRVTDALGHNRAYSNEQPYQDWRLANGYYQDYSSRRATHDPAFQAQVDAIVQDHSLTYSYDENGLITEVVDQQGFHTRYVYDDQENLIAETDRNAWGTTHSDSDYYRTLRAELGYTDAAGLGKLVSELSDAERAALEESFTRHYGYDERGNLIWSEDNAGNRTSYTYTDFNQLASATDPLGHTTSYRYDANQNLIERIDASGDITRFEYDAFGNLIRRIVFLDANDLTDPVKQQVTQYSYDAYGNLIETIDGEGAHSLNAYDHFGNLIRHTDGNGGLTQYSYDKDNRLLSVTDPEGFTTLNRYDAVGNRISVTDATGHTLTRVYDRNNRLICTLDPSAGDEQWDRLTRYSYDVVGNRTRVTDAEGRQTEYRYSVRRELVEIISAEVTGSDGTTPTRYSSTLAYDGEGNRIRSTDNRGFTTELRYTEDGLLRQQTDPNGHITRYTYDANANRIQIVAGVQLPAAKRQTLSFSYDEEDQLITQTDAEGNLTHYAYDAPGNRIALTDAEGNTTEYAYDHNNRLVRETRAAVRDPQSGAEVRYTVEHRFDANGNEIETVDENGHSIKYSFDKNDRVVIVEDGNGNQTVFRYDSRDNRTAVLIGVEAHVDADGQVVIDEASEAQVTRYRYDEFNQLVAKTDGLGTALAENDGELYQQLRQALGYAAAVADLSRAEQRALRELYTEHYSYDRVGNQTSRTDNEDRVTAYAYDALNRLASETDALGGSYHYRYDGNGNRVETIDALGRSRLFGYDGMDRQIERTDPLGMITQRVYDSFGNLETETRALGTADERAQHWEYDLNNRVVQETDPEGHQRSYEYDAVGNRLQVTDGQGNLTRYQYDALNRQVRIMDPQRFQTQIEYDGVGNRIALLDPRGGVTRFEYDAGNRQIATTDAEGRVTQFVYDARGNRIELHTAAGTAEEQVTHYHYDAENNLREVIDAEGNTSRNAYDRVYNTIAVTDANGHTTTTAFDALNRVVRVTDAAGGMTEYSYDAVGNRLTQTDALGRITQYAYDELDRQIVQTAADGVQTHYAYDAVGNRVEITRAANTDLAATDTFVYDKDDRLVRQEDALGHTTRYTYDASHNRTQVEDANGNLTNYFYDANNRVSGIEDAEGNLVRYAYDGNGNRIQVTDARGHTTTSYYNAANEVVMTVDGEGYVSAFEYDNNGNLVSQTLHMQALGYAADPQNLPVVTASAEDQTLRFEYDRVNRVSARIDAEGYRTEYAYDALGNRLQTRQYRDQAGSDIVITRSYYDALNREVASLSGEGHLTTYAYDALGNRLEQTRYDEQVTPPADGLPQPGAGDTGRQDRFVYDLNNRLVRSTTALGVHTDFTYDARGNRTAVIEAVGTDLERQTLYRYDSANRLVETEDALGLITHLELDANANVIDRFEAYGTEDQRQTRLAYDANNRVVSETRAVGTTIEVMAELSYDASGNLIARTDAAGTAEARTARFEYDANNRRTAEVNGEGDRTTSAYDGAGNRTRLAVGAGTPEARVNRFEYDKDNRLVAGVDGEGVRTEHRYDGAGNKVETVQAAGIAGEERHSLYAYDLDGRMVQITDPMGGVTQYEYDVLGNQTRILDANGGEQINRFDALGHHLSSLSAGGILTENSYDLRGNILSTTQSFADGSDARTTHYVYDILDRQRQINDPEGFSTRIDYDVFGNQTLITHGLYLPQPDDADYDPAKAAQAFAQSNQFSYDALDRMEAMTDAEGNITLYGYDRMGNRVSLTEASDTAPRTTEYRYDLANRLVETITPEGGVSRSTYDAAGNRIGETILQSREPTEVWIERSFEYDGNARLSAEIDGEGNRTEYAYDAMGNQIAVTQGVGTPAERTTAQEYDLNNRLAANIDGEGNRTEYTNDALGNRIRVTDAAGHVARYYFDAGNQLIALLDPEGYISNFSYDSAGNRTEERVYMTAYTGTISDTEAPVADTSALDRISSTQYDRNNHSVVRIEADGSRSEYRYDAVGNLKLERNFAEADVPREMSYVYDLDNRLRYFTDIDGTVTEYQYDGANNKIMERIVNPEDPNPIRETEYAYDLNNREISQTFDPEGLNYTQETQYDAAGNVVAKVDARGNATQFEYDLNNRQLAQTDPLGNRSQIAYDAVGNQASVTDARGNVTDYQYDHNGRLRFEIQPEVAIFTIDGGERLERPTVEHRYNAVGNEVQTVDAAGHTTTRYFDGNARQIAELNGDNALRTFTYNATGDQLSETLYMERLDAGAHDPATLPTGQGEARTTIREYDLAGRLIRVVHPEIEVTSLSGTDSASPTASTQTLQPEEQITYDAYGNAVESIDPNGNRILSYYDIKNQLIAQVDPMGYYTEWEYDTQGNVLEQKVYTEPLDHAELTPDELPWPPMGDVYQVSRVYDAANRLIEERSPRVEVFDLDATVQSRQERIITRYTYDANNNQTSRTLAASSPQAVTEYHYYDAANRQVAIVNGLRVLHRMGYDEAGNQTLQQRCFTPIASSVDLASLDGASTDFATLVAANEADQTRAMVYDAVNRLSQEIDRMGSGDADDLSKSHSYNARGEETRVTDEDGYITQLAYDGMGRVTTTINGNGNGSRAEYDAAGNATRVYTGQMYDLATGELASQAVAVTESTIATTLEGDSLDVAWEIPADSEMQTYLVYGLASVPSGAIGDEADLGYTHQSALQGSWFSSEAGVQVDLAALGAGAGDAIYFRVVSQDIAGNLAWGEERQITIPPRFTALDVEQPDASTLSFDVTFEAGVVSPVVQYGAPGSLGSSQALVDQGNGHYTATLSGLSDPRSLAYRIVWQDAAGISYQSDERSLQAGGEHIGALIDFAEQTVGSGSTVAVELQLPADLIGRAELVTAQWYAVGDDTLLGSVAVEDAEAPTPGDGLYNLILGEGAPLDAGDYRIVLTAALEEEDVILDSFTLTLGGTTPVSESRQIASWTAPAVGDERLVLLDGAPVDAVYDEASGRLMVATDLASGESADYTAFYGEAVAQAHTTTLTPQGSDLSVNVALDAAEAAQIDGDLHLAWRTSIGGIFDFGNEQILTASGNDYSTNLILPAAGQYDLKLYYTDSAGHEVIVDWLRYDTTAGATTVTANSLRVLAAETDGRIERTASALQVVPGLHSGSLEETALSLTLAHTGTGEAGDSRTTDGTETGYYTENRYNALNVLIGTNAETGIWRDFGVDAIGNVLATYEQGFDPQNGDPLRDAAVLRDSYATYDRRNRKLAEFGYDTGAGRIVMRYSYDVSDNLVSQTDEARGVTQTTTYNPLGNPTRVTISTNGATTTSYYDRLGRVVREVDALGNQRDKRYDLGGRLIQEVDGEGQAIDYRYDVFDRRIRMTNALDDSIAMAYDQRDRLVQTTAEDVLLSAGGTPQDLVTTYGYDGRNNRTRTTDANGHIMRQEYDALNRVIDTITYQGGHEVHSRQQYDAYGNLVMQSDGAGRTTSYFYGAFGRIRGQVDPGDRVTEFDYDSLGNLIHEENAQSGKDIDRTFDINGRLLSVTDHATGVATSYSYSLAGDRLSEDVTTPGHEHDRHLTYRYDALGQLTRWADSVTRLHANNQWDIAGNLQRVYTDTGYDPKGENSANDPDYRYVDHRYSYDGNHRVTQITQRGANWHSYTYDAAGNRTEFTEYATNGTPTTLTYRFNSLGWVLNGTTSASNNANNSSWNYDAVGNVTRFVYRDDKGEVKRNESFAYLENNLLQTTVDHKEDQTTTQVYDLGGRLTQIKVKGDDSKVYFNHYYAADGRLMHIRAKGKKLKGNTYYTYDANDNPILINQGKGEDQVRNDLQRLLYNNDNQILYQFDDNGKKGDAPKQTEFLYANGNPIAETGTDRKSELQVRIDTGNYNLVTELGEDAPQTAISQYQVREGDTLQSIAAALYGNPSLWFVLAEANGIELGETLRQGQTLEIPNNIKDGRLTAETHLVYDQGEIIDQTLPNIKAKKGGCSNFVMILIVAVIAVVAFYLLPVVAGAVGGALFAGTSLAGTAFATVASYAIAGAVVGAAASAVQQGLFIALGYQDEFSWKSVAAGAISGALSGAAQGLGVANQALIDAGMGGLKYAETAARALQVSSVASKQLIENGKITSWTSLATSALSPIRTAGVDKPLFELDWISQTQLDYITPWAELAETAIRNEGDLKPLDWANAIGSTLTTAFGPSTTTVYSNGRAIRLNDAFNTNQLVTNLAVGGALALFDEDAAVEYLASSVGNQIGQYIGQELARASGLQAAAETAVNELKKSMQPKPDQQAAQAAKLEAEWAARTRIVEGTEEDPNKLDAPTSKDNPEEWKFKEHEFPWDRSMREYRESTGESFTLGEEENLTEAEKFENELVKRMRAEGASEFQIQEALRNSTVVDIKDSLAKVEDLKAIPAQSVENKQINATAQQTLETLEPVLEVLAGIKAKIENLRKNNEWLAFFAEKGLQLVVGGPVKLLVSTVIGYAVGDKLADIQNAILDKVAKTLENNTNYSENRIKYLIGGAAFALGIVTGIAATFKYVKNRRAKKADIDQDKLNQTLLKDMPENMRKNFIVIDRSKFDKIYNQADPKKIDKFISDFKAKNKIDKYQNVAIFQLKLGDEVMTFAVKNAKGNQLSIDKRMLDVGIEKSPTRKPQYTDPLNKMNRANDSERIGLEAVTRFMTKRGNVGTETPRLRIMSERQVCLGCYQALSNFSLLMQRANIRINIDNPITGTKTAYPNR